MSRDMFDVMDAEYQKRRKQERELSWFLLKLTLLNSVRPGLLVLLIGIVASFFVGLGMVFTASNSAIGIAFTAILSGFNTWRMVFPKK